MLRERVGPGRLHADGHLTMRWSRPPHPRHGLHRPFGVAWRFCASAGPGRQAAAAHRQTLGRLRMPSAAMHEGLEAPRFCVVLGDTGERL